MRLRIIEHFMILGILTKSSILLGLTESYGNTLGQSVKNWTNHICYFNNVFLCKMLLKNVRIADFRKGVNSVTINYTVSMNLGWIWQVQVVNHFKNIHVWNHILFKFDYNLEQILEHIFLQNWLRPPPSLKKQPPPPT